MGIVKPSYQTFCNYVNKRPQYEQTKKRKGSKAAYNQEEWYWELELKTPRHGDRPFEICHMDHTELDISLICSKTNKVLGRPWATFLVDAYTRRFLAIYITFEKPSYRSCMMTLKECVKRHSRLPKFLVVDGGKEFQSIYFETLLALYNCNKKLRPGAKPRFGTVCERLFGTANTTFINNLLGNTQIMKNVRQVTKEVNPRNLATWTLASFSKLLSEWAYDVYDTIIHPALGESPREAFMTGLANTGSRSFTLIPYDETFYMLSLPSTRKGTAKVEQGRGVKINSRYYWSEVFRDPDIAGKSFPVKYDPYNMGIGYVYVKNRWVELHSEYYSTFVNRTEREVTIASEELRQRLKMHGQSTEITAAKLANFLKSAEAEELLLIQRLKDSELKEAFRVLDGGKKRKSQTQSEISSLKLVRNEKSPRSPLNLEVYGEF